ncbi:MAG TPA: PEGA domain-containing protein [Methanoregula sp.]|nr:PEGA domain-containing protein [Methanoregula sp.]
MLRGRVSSTILFAVFLAILILILPVSAYNVAIYGTNSGFDPDLHPGLVNVVRSIPGATGADLDNNVDQFTQPSVDVIILGGESSFSPSTAAKIEAAVAGGKILVVTYPCNHRFDKSLPASNGGTTAGGQYLEVSDPTSVVSKAVFAQLPTTFDLQGTAPDKEQVIAKAGTITVMNYDTGMPALLYGKYGKGYVIEWTTVPSPSYMNGAQADIILHRMILGLLPAPSVTQTNAATPKTTVPTQTTVATPKTTVPTKIPTSIIITPGSTSPLINPTLSTTAMGSTGEVMVYSSPTGASILIDGNYLGTTPGKVNGIPAGSHILRLTMTGYYDYEGSIYVVPGDTTQGYGTLQPIAQITSVPTTVPTVIVPVIVAAATPAPTEDAGLLGNSSVLVAIIGVITAIIASAATIYTHKPPKKE